MAVAAAATAGAAPEMQRRVEASLRPERGCPIPGHPAKPLVCGGKLSSKIFQALRFHLIYAQVCPPLSSGHVKKPATSLISPCTSSSLRAAGAIGPAWHRPPRLPATQHVHAQPHGCASAGRGARANVRNVRAGRGGCGGKTCCAECAAGCGRLIELW